MFYFLFPYSGCLGCFLFFYYFNSASESILMRLCKGFHQEKHIYKSEIAEGFFLFSVLIRGAPNKMLRVECDQFLTSSLEYL